MAACRYGISLRVFNLISLTHSLSSSILNTRRKISYLSAPTYHLLFLVRSFSRISSHNYTIYVYYTGYARKNNTCVSWCAERVAWSAVSEILWYKRRKLTLIWSQRSERCKEYCLLRGTILYPRTNGSEVWNLKLNVLHCVDVAQDALYHNMNKI